MEHLEVSGVVKCTKCGEDVEFKALEDGIAYTTTCPECNKSLILVVQAEVAVGEL